MPTNSNAIHQAKWPALGGLLVLTILLTSEIPTAFAIDKVIHTLIATLACSGAAVIGLSKWLPRDVDSEQHEGISLGAVGKVHASRETSPFRDIPPTVSSRRLRLLFVVLVLAICLRVETLRNILRNVQCSSRSLELLVPCALAIVDYAPTMRSTTPSLLEDHARHDPFARSFRALFWAPWLTAFCATGGILALGSTTGPRSTVICAASLPHRSLVPFMQCLGSALDIAILYCISRLLLLHDTRGSRSLGSRASSVGYALTLSAAVLLAVGIVYYLVQGQARAWILTITPFYFWSALKLNVLAVFTVLCALICLLTMGAVTTSLLITFASTITITTMSGFASAPIVNSDSPALAFWPVCLMVITFTAYFRLTADQASGGTVSKLIRGHFYLLLAIVVIIWISIWRTDLDTVMKHPIDRLIFDAKSRHEDWSTQAVLSRNLIDAAEDYERRYGRLPPPHFDKWYAFATHHQSAIIDDFDSIERDLQPFFALSPQEIRQRTWELISNPWNDAAGVIIRNGIVTVAPNVVGNHRWMADGLAEMIGKFAEWLPDMDLALNLNDEPRVAVPYEIIKPMKRAGEELAGGTSGHPVGFSHGRAEQWTAIPEDPNREKRMQELSWQRTFHRYGVLACRPDSTGRTQRHWNTGSFCNECAEPHCQGPFLSNWTIAADTCHQPDLADLHGLYLSPAAFKGTHELYPIFSQSKVHGFNDILYPSPWNYLDNAKYAPTEEYPEKSFAEKENTIYWRGSTSEGVSKGMGSWQSMTRQRLVHMANNIGNTSLPQILLLPTEDSQMLEYKTVPSHKLTQILPTDVHIVDAIARCAGQDCVKQATEFAPLAPPADFQSHWKYKYLLDMDGAGFSGRFIPFLRSKSLPFKTALFREWWDDRITPWLHFVPLDLRGHGFWATYAYFHGVDGDLGKGIGEVKIDAHARDAERIALSGREWAGKVLRKEDMEIYMFRLLLEWGRITDDGREKCGFHIEGIEEDEPSI